MALQTQPSRFAILPDDVQDPVQAKKGEGKKKKKTDSNKGPQGGGGGDAASKKKAAAKGKTLKSLAFGGSGTAEGKKKGGNQAPAPPPPVGVGVGRVGNGEVIGNGGPHPLRNNTNMTTAQWEDWQKRDSELVDEDYESQLHEALVQSKLDYHNEAVKKDTAKTKKSKKKGVTVPMNEFNATVLENASTNGINGPSDPGENEEELLEKLRIEARQQIDKQKELAVQRELLATRQSPKDVYKHPHSKERSKDAVDVVEVDEKTTMIENLKVENAFLKGELESYKSRLKKVHDIFQGAQELKDKAKLIFTVETLTKTQQDLQEQVQELHSQLEQEKSKSRTAMNDCRRLLELQSRRRTNTESSN